MATLSHSESRCMYSWWWDSHVSPKNSKWLQENLSGMDQNIKAMIKLIDEDGDSFAKRAEMFYKKRPELMQLIEEFYRAYRALAERYDHANSALRQAHQTMSEAFPDRLPPLMQPDEFEEIDKLCRKKELKQLLHVKLNSNGNETAKEFGFDFEDERSEDGEREGEHEVKHLQSEISRLLQRNENLMKEMDLESKHVQALEEGIFKLESKKADALIQYKLSMTRISDMATHVSNIKQELCKFNHEMMDKLKSAEEQCNAMERANKIVQSKIEMQKIELKKKTNLLAEVKCAAEEEYNRRMAAEMSLTSLEKLYNHSKEEVKHLLLAIKNSKEKLRVIEMSRNYLEDKISEHKNVLDDLHEQNRIYKIKARDLQNDVNFLQEAKSKIENELRVYIEENSHLKGELCCLNEQMETVSMNNLVLENSLSDANNDLKELKEKVDEMEATCEILLSEVTTNVTEKGIFVNQMETISQYVERLSKKNTNLEQCLFDANSEIKGLRSIFRFLSDQKSILLADKNSLVAQVENLKIKNLELQNLYSNLEEEKKSSVHQATKLENHVTSFSSQIASLDNQIHHLQKEICAHVEDIKIEQHNSMNSSFEILILQQSLRDMEEKFSILSREYQRLLETSRCAENVSCVMEDKVLKLQFKVDELETRTPTNQDDHINLKAGNGGNDLTSERAIEIENSSTVKKQEHEKLQLTTLAAQLENFVLKRCIFDVKDQNAFLYDELTKKTDEVHKCEEEMRTQLNEIQVSRVNAAIFEGKVVELLLACESLESLSMSRREILNKDIALKIDYIEELKKSLDDLKAENSTLKSDLSAFSSLLMPLADGVLSIEEQLHSLTKEKGRKSCDSETSDILYNDEVNHQSVENGSIATRNGFSNLLRLIAKIEDLQSVIMDTKKALAQERLESEANIKSAKKKIGHLKVDKVLVKGITKDLVDYYRVAKNDNVESDDQMLELWETSERDDIQLVSIDKLEISNNGQSARKWYKSIIEKLNSNGLRLSVVQKNVHELKAKIEYGTFKVQLREIEYDIYDQIDITLALKNEVENSFLSDSERKKISDEENKCSEVIGKLELETQKIEYIFLKTKEEEENKKCRCVDKKSSIISMRYLQFKKDGKVKKKGRFCGCMKPNTKV